jgi:hypothetical protein
VLFLVYDPRLALKKPRRASVSTEWVVVIVPAKPAFLSFPPVGRADRREGSLWAKPRPKASESEEGEGYSFKPPNFISTCFQTFLL